MIYVRQRITTNSLSFGGAWIIVFTALKLLGLISVGWWLPLLPLWLPFAILAVLGFVAGSIWIIYRGYEAYGAKKRSRARGILGS